MDTTKTPDDLEAVRVIAAALAPFKQTDQERIIRWAREKVGLAPGSAKVSDTPAAPATSLAAGAGPASLKQGVTIKQLVEQKSPKSDNQFAAVVAYYHQFEAPELERKPTVTADDLRDACRKADRQRLNNPGQTLINAYHAGLLDRSARGEFTINSVGENLVAMALPEASGSSKVIKKTMKPRAKARAAKRKSTR